MKVLVRFMGPLKDFVGEENVPFDLPDQATYGALLVEIGQRFGHCFPDKIWDTENSCFRAGLLIMGTGRDLEDPETVLMDDEEIKVLPMLGGG